MQTKCAQLQTDLELTHPAKSMGIGGKWLLFSEEGALYVVHGHNIIV